MIESNLLLIDYENRQVDLSSIHHSFRVFFFIGSHQKAPNTVANIRSPFRQIDYLKIDGNGKNALDFHIAFELGRVFETEPLTKCFILSGDKGFNPLITYLNRIGLSCTRIESVDQLIPAKITEQTFSDRGGETVCRTCRKACTIDHSGGRWCTNCGSFAVPPTSKKILAASPDEYRLSHFSRRIPMVPRSVSNTCFHCGISISDDSLLCDACD